MRDRRAASCVALSLSHVTALGTPRMRSWHPTTLANGPAADPAPTTFSPDLDILFFDSTTTTRFGRVSLFSRRPRTLHVLLARFGRPRVPTKRSGLGSTLASTPSTTGLASSTPPLRSRFEAIPTVWYNTQVPVCEVSGRYGVCEALECRICLPHPVMGPSFLHLSIPRRCARISQCPRTTQLRVICMRIRCATRPLELARHPQPLGGPQICVSRLRASGTTQLHLDDWYGTPRR